MWSLERAPSLALGLWFGVADASALPRVLLLVLTSHSVRVSLLFCGAAVLAVRGACCVLLHRVLPAASVDALQWEVPAFFLAIAASSSRIVTLVEQAYRLRGRRPGELDGEVKVPDLPALVFMEMVVAQAAVLEMVPIVGVALGFLIRALAFALAAFYFRWSLEKKGRQEMLEYIENRWVYFLGFGAVGCIFCRVSQMLIGRSLALFISPVVRKTYDFKTIYLGVN